jgi:hypothetical protein
MDYGNTQTPIAIAIANGANAGVVTFTPITSLGPKTADFTVRPGQMVFAQSRVRFTRAAGGGDLYFRLQGTNGLLDLAMPVNSTLDMSLFSPTVGALSFASIFAAFRATGGGNTAVQIAGAAFTNNQSFGVQEMEIAAFIIG